MHGGVICRLAAESANDFHRGAELAKRVASSLDRYVLRAVRSDFSDEKKLSIAALSQTFPERLCVPRA
jgi:hypothetical protein